MRVDGELHLGAELKLGWVVLGQPRFDSDRAWQFDVADPEGREGRIGLGTVVRGLRHKALDGPSPQASPARQLDDIDGRSPASCATRTNREGDTAAISAMRSKEGGIVGRPDK